MHAVLSFRARKHRHVLIATGLLAIALVSLMGAQIHGKVSAPVLPAATAPLQMMVAARSVAAGSTLVAADIRAKTVSGTPPAGALLSSESAIGRVAGKSFNTGDTLTDDGLRDAASLSIAAHVAAGQRAFSIRVAEDEIVGGFLQSADHVDVFATIPGSVFPVKDAQDHPDRSQTVLLLQDILVLAVGENLATRGTVQSTAQTVSLSLTPQQLARLALALRFGKISLAIRNPGDDAVSSAAPVTLADLVPAPDVPADKPVVHARPRVRGIPFYAGTKATFVGGGNAP